VARFKRKKLDRREILKGLEAVVGADARVFAAYLFGSLARDEGGPMSDIDVAVCLDNDGDAEEHRLALLLEISRRLGVDEVDLVVLNRAPVTLQASVIRDGVVFVDRNPFARRAFESLARRKAFDFSIKERDIFRRRFGVGG
jgi:predicted nucleotidyltransferase